MRADIQHRLESHGIKPSLQRMAILEYLMTHPTHPTVDAIFTDLYPTIPTLSKATVYNTLHLLVQSGAVNMITIDELAARYDACMHPHMHFKCRRCGAIMDVEAMGVPDIRLPEGVVMEQCHTYCYGLCAACNKEEALH